MGIFDARKSFKPFEYPKAMEFIDALQATYWTHKEFNFTQDISDFKVELSDYERETFKRCLLAISQIEVSVKTFWAKLFDHFPKPEFNALGVQLAFNELVHERSYSEILELLGLNTEFEQILQIPVIQGRVEYLTKYIKGSADNAKEAYALSVALFGAFVENASLFSQLFIAKSYNKHKGYFKGVDNVISATIIEETIHANVAAWIISIIREEYPEWFNTEFEKKIKSACIKAYEAELNIVKWILQSDDSPYQKELSFLSYNTIDEFLKNRFNQSLVLLGVEPIFEVSILGAKMFEWFEEEYTLDRHTDFFNKRPTTYSRNKMSVTAEDLF